MGTISARSCASTSATLNALYSRGAQFFPECPTAFTKPGIEFIEGMPLPRLCVDPDALAAAVLYVLFDNPFLPGDCTSVRARQP